jgi:hypothetical protein
VQVNTAHGRGGRLCRVLYLCCALSSAVAVPYFFDVRFDPPLPCLPRCRVFFGGFAMRCVVAVLYMSMARQRNLCRARAHGRGCQHGSACFSGSASYVQMHIHGTQVTYRSTRRPFLGNCADLFLAQVLAHQSVRACFGMRRTVATPAVFSKMGIPAVRNVSSINGAFLTEFLEESSTHFPCTVRFAESLPLGRLQRSVSPRAHRLTPAITRSLARVRVLESSTHSLPLTHRA